MTKLEVRLSTTLEVPTTQAESKSEVPPHDGEVLSGEVLRPSATELTGSPRWTQQQLRRNSTNTAVLVVFAIARSRWAVAAVRGMECTAAATDVVAVHNVKGKRSNFRA